MSPDQIFSLATYLVLPGWALLLLAPWWKWTLRLISSVIIPLLLCGIYVYLIFDNLQDAEGSFTSLTGLAQLSENPHLLLAGWVHYLAFDLFVGSWEIRDAQRIGIPYWHVAPCLIFTFLFGPVGLLLYFGIRLITKGAVYIEREDHNNEDE